MEPRNDPEQASRRARMGAALVAVFLAGMAAGNLLGGASLLGATASMESNPAFASFQAAWELLHDHYALPEEIDDTELLYGAARGMMQALGDTSHSAFLDPGDAQAFRDSMEGELVGIGIHVEFDEAYPEIVDPIAGSPAEAAGLQDGDLIVAIDDVQTDRLPSAEVADLLRGGEGENVELLVVRPANDREFTVTVTRARIDVDPVSWALLPGDVVLIRLRDFSEGAAAELRSALQSALDLEARGIVLDLRGNPGGLVNEARLVASEFLPEGKVLYWEYRRNEDPRAIRLRESNGLALDLPMVVLVDRKSASAAEILAASLRDNDRSEIVGEATFGTATVVLSYGLEDGSLVSIGASLWKAPDGEFARDIGIQPTIEALMPATVDPIDFDEEAQLTGAEIAESGDSQLETALGIVSERIEADDSAT
jgi:carboxyl-terminal processing protease